MMAVTIDVLRSSIQTPVLLATMQSLPVHQRLRGHTIIKGLLDPFSFLTIGIFLWVFTGKHQPDFQILSIVLFGLILCWLLFSFSVDKNYKETLQTALRNRTLNERDISITDKESLEFLLEKMVTGSETEAISVLKLISSKATENKEFLEKALAHPSTNVKQFALHIIESQQYIEALPTLIGLFDSPQHIDILPDLIHTVSALDSSYNMSAFLTHAEARVVYAATIASYSKEDISQRQMAENNVEELFNTNNPQGRIKALEIVAELKSNAYNQIIIDSFDDEDIGVRKAAWCAAGCIADNELMERLISYFRLIPNDTGILEALAKGGNKSLPVIKEFLIDHRCEGSKSRKLISLLVKIGGEASANILDECLNRFPEDADTLMRSMVLLNIKNKQNNDHYKNSIKQNLSAGAAILFKLQFAQHYNLNVAKALELELQSIKNKCLWLFSFLYDTETIKKAQAGFQANTRESVANALELVQLAVPKHLGQLFCTLFEIASTNEKCMQLQRTIRAPHLNDATLVKNILFDIDYNFNNWTKACVLYSLQDKEQLIRKEYIEPFLHSENELLKDTAAFIFSKSHVSENHRQKI
jgi:hypothetical protein